MTRRIIAQTALALLVCTTPWVERAAHAQQPVAVTPEASARADALNKQAVEALKRDSFAEAEAPAREAWSLKQSYDIASNLGLAELGLKRYRDAAEHLSFALNTFPANGKPEHKKLVELSLARAAAEVGGITLTVNVEGATIYVDEHRVGSAPLREAIFLEPGQHELRGELAGYGDAKQTVTAVRGQSGAVTLTLERTAGPPGTTGPVGPPPKKSMPLIITGFGVAAAGIAVGVVGVVASSSNSSSATTAQQKLAAAGGPGACNIPANAKACADLDSSLKNVGTFRNIGIVGFAVGGAALIGTVVYLAVPMGTQSQVTTGVSATPDGARWTLRGTF